MNCPCIAAVSEETPYGRAAIEWELIDGQAIIHVAVPANTTAEICLPGKETEAVDSGTYVFTV